MVIKADLRNFIVASICWIKANTNFVKLGINSDCMSLDQATTIIFGRKTLPLPR